MADSKSRTDQVAGLRRLLTVAEAAAILSVDERTLRAWIAARKIGVVRLSSRCLRIAPDALERFIDERCDGPDLR